jgi:hypothetical protein
MLVAVLTWALSGQAQASFLVTPILIFCPTSHSITTKFSLQYLVPYSMHFFLIKIVVCGEMKNSVFVTPGCVGVYNVPKMASLGLAL